MKPTQNSHTIIVRLDKVLGHRIRMTRCIEEEPSPPMEPMEFEKWCESGKSGRPIQTHLGDYGVVDRIVNEEALRVLFDDGDERLVYVDEIDVFTNGTCN